MSTSARSSRADSAEARRLVFVRRARVFCCRRPTSRGHRAAHPRTRCQAQRRSNFRTRSLRSKIASAVHRRFRRSMATSSVTDASAIRAFRFDWDTDSTFIGDWMLVKRSLACATTIAALMLSCGSSSTNASTPDDAGKGQGDNHNSPSESAWSWFWAPLTLTYVASYRPTAWARHRVGVRLHQCDHSEWER